MHHGWTVGILQPRTTSVQCPSLAANFIMRCFYLWLSLSLPPHPHAWTVCAHLVPCSKLKIKSAASLGDWSGSWLWNQKYTSLGHPYVIAWSGAILLLLLSKNLTKRENSNFLIERNNSTWSAYIKYLIIYLRTTWKNAFCKIPKGFSLFLSMIDGQ